MAANGSKRTRIRKGPAASKPKAGSPATETAEKPPVVETAEKPPVVETAEKPPELGTPAPVPAEPDPEQALAASEKDLQKLRQVRRRRTIKACILAVVAILFVAFVLQNAQPVEVRLVFGTASIGLIWVIVAATLLGGVVGFVVGRPEKDLLLHGPTRRKKDS